MDIQEMKRVFFNKLWRYDNDIVNAYWDEFMVVRNIASVQIDKFIQYVIEMMDYSEGLKQW